MAKYLIHSCIPRQWYVDEYLIPSMLKQGIHIDDIDVYYDENNDGCLESCMKSFLNMPDDNDGTWHLQDDVIISASFKERTEHFNHSIVCGFCSQYDTHKLGGWSNVSDAWYSFPCIRIPNSIAKQCGKFYYNSVIHNPEYRVWIHSKKYDDSIFKIFLEMYYPEMKVFNVIPNLVNHIDYLIGGSIINSVRNDKIIASLFWDENNLIEALRTNLKGRF